MSVPRVAVTQTQHDALEALARRGTMASAAHDRGLSLDGYRHRLRKVRKRSGLTTYQLLYLLGSGRIIVQDVIWPSEDAA